MTDLLERRWRVRQAVLDWLVSQARNGMDRPALSAEAVASAVHWDEGELGTDEVNQASDWLNDEGLIEGQGTWGGGIPRPRLTTHGEKAATSGLGVRHYVDNVSAAVSDSRSTSSVPSAIFLVHGRNTGTKYEVARWLEQNVDTEVVILDEQANRGRTVIEKFQAHADAAKFAVVLLTGDDMGGVVGGPQSARARQNVIFELGYFYGKLGRDRVAVINDGVETPSDFVGVAYIPFASNWKHDLSVELRAAGFQLRY
ncbi:nucleotide-binding protein [Williamsia sp.]|uniref:nucleotide-binding protein n=1 Tax=Williamsia sp. TaxID=1872085 RepID=UPI002F935EE0